MGVVFEANPAVARPSRRAEGPAPLLRLDRGFLERFRREAHAAASLHHTNIVPVFGVGEDGGCHYFAMQCIRGQSLEAILDEVRKFREKGRAAGGKPAGRPWPCGDPAGKGLRDGTVRDRDAARGRAESRRSRLRSDRILRPRRRPSAPPAEGPVPSARLHSDSLAGQDNWRIITRSIARVGLCRWPRRWPTPTGQGCSIATSSRRTC